MAEHFRPKRDASSHQRTKFLEVADRTRVLAKWIEDYFTGNSVGHPRREHFEELLEMFKKAERTTGRRRTP